MIVTQIDGVNIPDRFFATNKMGERAEFGLIEILGDGTGFREIVLQNITTKDNFATEVELEWFRQRKIEEVTNA